MPIPTYQALMLPLLRYLADGEQQRLRDLIDHLAQEFSLTVEERRQLLPSGQQPIFDNRVGWARTYLKKAGLLESPRRGWVQITERGREVLAQNLDRIDIDFLKQFEEFRAFIAQSSTTTVTNDVMPSDDTGSPEELLEQAYETLKQNLLAELLEQVKEASAAFFERLVVELLVRMGYGGSFQEAARTIGRSGDEGIDGIIKEDRLGFDVVYVQAKRWGQTVGRPEVEKFAGALQGQRARKGVFITTSTFTEEARQYVEKIDSKIVLVDGERLAELMFEHNVGVATVTSYPVKRIDNDFFLEE
ncbi:MAG TPA: restriction endonuclease [Thermosynechococcus sp. M3746_W2019_013]|uniref:restriction endonuclease n=1 Tax=Thermosynechococcus sp. M3746_W2019_013 TaxID=2747806 RepID=UPI0019FA0747|nr:restriction endonuclease [Thermosynechococcus sp. M3746_W2019_013]HIK22401.1 restriction endonuclease [Thermosynechococcus sp. M3746_W2019_013]